MRHELATVCAAAPEQLGFIENPWGKPMLIDHPGIHFNLSHSQHLALLGISTRAPIGVDIEMIQHWSDAELHSLSRTIMTEAERQAMVDIIGQSGNAAASQAFLTAWTRKEACVKALGLGLSYDVRQLEVGITQCLAQITAPANGDSLRAARQLQLYTAPGPQGAIISIAAE